MPVGAGSAASGPLSVRCTGGLAVIVSARAPVRVSDTTAVCRPVLDVLMYLYRPLDRRGPPNGRTATPRMVPPQMAAM